MKTCCSSLATKRSLEFLALVIIGDSVLTAVDPERHIGLWRRGPDAWRQSMDAFIERPGMTRVLGIVFLALGVWLAESQKDDE